MAGIRKRRRRELRLVARGDIWLCALDPTVVSEIRKTRPCLVVSPDEIHRHWRTTLVAPLTTGARPTRFRVPITFEGKTGLVLLDQVRALDRMRLVRRLGGADPAVLGATLAILREMFAD